MQLKKKKVNDEGHRIKNQILPLCSYETLNESLNLFGPLPYLSHSYFQHLPDTSLWLTLWSDICSAGLLRRFLQKTLLLWLKMKCYIFFRKISMTYQSTIFVSWTIFSNLCHLEIHFFSILTAFLTSYLIIIIILRGAGNCGQL